MGIRILVTSVLFLVLCCGCGKEKKKQLYVKKYNQQIERVYHLKDGRYCYKKSKARLNPSILLLSLNGIGWS